MTPNVVDLVRHGNIPGYEGDVALTDEGRQAARRTGRRLADGLEDEAVVAFLHGPARRARETAWEMCAALEGATGLPEGEDRSSTLDPIFSLAWDVVLKPHASREAVFLTADVDVQGSGRLEWIIPSMFKILTKCSDRIL